MDNIVIIDNTKYIKDDNLQFYSIDEWGRVVMYYKDKNLYFKSVELYDDIIADTNKTQIHTLHTVAYMEDEEGYDGEPDRPTIFKVFAEKVKDKINFIAYKKIK